MEYRAISADGHVNEHPTSWVDRLPDEFEDRGPHIIETPDTTGHASIMEGQARPSPTGFSSSSSWPVDDELGREILERAGASESEIERIMWRNAADRYKLPYDEPRTVRAAA